MTIDNFILNKPELDFFFSPRGRFKTLHCGDVKEEIFKLYRQFIFNHNNKIESEIGFQNTWFAYPPLSTPPQPTEYRRLYQYNDNRLELISEYDKESNALVKFHKFRYRYDKLIEISETTISDENHPPKRTKFAYNSDGYLIQEKTFLASMNGSNTYLCTDINRNRNNQIIKTTNSNSVEHKEKLILKEEISTIDVVYESDKVKRIFHSANQDKTYITTAEIIKMHTQLIRKIRYPSVLDKEYVQYEYDPVNNNVIQKVTKYNDRVRVQLFKYE